MVPANFEYFRAASVEEAVALLHRHSDAKLLAGGHSLLPIMKLRLAEPAALIDISKIHILRGITHHGDGIRVGALTTHGTIASSEVLQRECGLLSEAAARIGDPQVRNKGTLGGNIAHADPASDLPAVLLALGAKVQLAGPGGNRTVAAGDFFTDLLETEVREDEVLTAVDLPVLGDSDGTSYLKFEHPASGYAICGAAAVVKMDSGTCREARLAFNGVTATPHEAAAVGSALAGSDLSDQAIASAIDAHLKIEEPLGDIQASGEYRVELAKVYGRRALQQARDRAR
ncbi:MAG: xanthine dehydrogenase family protein subunit M [Acidobacteriota bacterium]